MLPGGGSVEGTPWRRDPELRGDLSHRLSDLVLFEPEQVILALQVLEVLVKLVHFLLRGGARVVVGRYELGQQAEDLPSLLDPLRDSLSRFSSGCMSHGQSTSIQRSCLSYYK